MPFLSHLPPEARADLPRVILLGTHSLILEQHKGLAVYDQNKIIAKTKSGRVTVCGENLCISFFGVYDMKIDGEIHTLFCEVGNNEN